MNRLKLKCYGASTGLHVILLIVLVVGPGFLASRTKDDYKPDMPVLTFIPLTTTDKEFSGGGNPKAATPPPAAEPVQPTPAPKLPDPPQPEPVKSEPAKPAPVKPAPEPVKVKPPEPTPAPETIKPDPKRPPSEDPDVVTLKPPRTLPKVNLTLTDRTVTKDTGKADKARAEARERAKEQEREERAAHERAQQYASALSGLRVGLSGRTEVGTFGPGGGGLPYANFKQTVMTVYFNAWEPPAGIADEKAVTKASVTIARDGKVVSQRITVPSGNPAVDASVRRALERVKFVAPLPADSKESERTVPVVFDLTAKRDLG